MIFQSIYVFAPPSRAEWTPSQWASDVLLETWRIQFKEIWTLGRRHYSVRFWLMTEVITEQSMKYLEFPLHKNVFCTMKRLKTDVWGHLKVYDWCALFRWTDNLRYRHNCTIHQSVQNIKPFILTPLSHLTLQNSLKWHFTLKCF